MHGVVTQIPQASGAPAKRSERSKMLRKKLKAAAASRIASKRLMDSLSHASGFNVAEMRDLRQQFGDAANEEGVCGVFTPTLVATTECCW